MPQNHALFKGKLQVQWSLLGIEDSLSFSPAQTEKGKPLPLRKIFSYFLLFKKEKKKSFLRFWYHCFGFFLSVCQRILPGTWILISQIYNEANEA